MSRVRHIPRDTLDKQAAAADPANSVWVPANAGSGKTHVLAQRVIRLLLRGTDPARILCLTYTRAAAANMAGRVTRNLAEWAVMPREPLADALAALDGKRPSAHRIDEARRLFARALETPGGLKIQTIHAFCEAVLHQFTLEANIAGHFELMDPAMEEALVAEARRRTILSLAEPGNETLASAFDHVMGEAGENGLDTLLDAIVATRKELKRFITAAGGETDGFAPLFAEFGLTPQTDTGELMAGLWPDSWFDADLARAIAARAAEAKKANAASFAGALLAACAPASPDAVLDALGAAFLSGKEGDQKPRALKNLMAKGVGEHFPDFPDRFEDFSCRLLDVLDRRATLRMLHGTAAMLTLADRLIANYERLKHARGLLDFDDLVTRTVALLARQDASAWVHYKLDRGIDHILLDEAQDTSPDQWDLVRRLAEEFFAGSGQHEDRLRTFFAVGDEKQSIYSFQGAEPAAFYEHGHMFGRRAEAAGLAFERVRLDRSFRSTDDVLAAVDRVFAKSPMRDGLTHDIEDIRHSGVRGGEPGSVELWPSVGPEAVEQPDDWTRSIDHASAPAVRLAGSIADTVAGWLAAGELLEGRGRLIGPGDVLVLVRKRGGFVHALTRALKNKQIPVAGADRLVLADHIAVKDLIALGRVLGQPDDDLSLAAVLKSPIFGFDDDDLIDLSGGRRQERPLHAVLRASEEPRCVAAADRLAGWRDEIGFKSPFAFFGDLLARDGVRRAMIARLGHEAGDVLDEFLRFCLEAERAAAPSMDGFLSLLETGSPEIKRELDQARGEVRIMTAHAAKGLEAPVVFLVDSGGAPVHDSHLPAIMRFKQQGGHWEGPGLLWRTGKWKNAARTRFSDSLKQRGEEEYRRLLYVGMTRAEDRLIVCGFNGPRGRHERCWHAAVESALRDDPHTREVEDAGGQTILRFRVTPELPSPVPGLPDEPPAPSPRTLPQALSGRELPPVERLPRPLTPSSVGALIDPGPDSGLGLAGSPVLDRTREPSVALRRGVATHRLLQMLPGLDPERRIEAARLYLDTVGAAWPPNEREDLLGAVARILDDAAFTPLFAPGSRAELSISGTVRLGEAERIVAGTIDRIAVSGQAVLIVDYKTTRPVPVSHGAVPSGHVAQIALYAELVRALYPGRPVRAALLYTAGPALFEFDGAALAQSLAGLAAA